MLDSNHQIPLNPIGLSEAQREDICDKTALVIQQASQVFNHKFKNINIKFDLKGRSIGMYVVRGRQRYIRYNAFIFARFYDDCLAQTVVHEVAHYVCDCLYGLGKTKPHGPEWKSIMKRLGAIPNVTSQYDLVDMPSKTYRQFDYQCSCQKHQLSSIRHNKILRGKASYRCRYCNDKLILSDES